MILGVPERWRKHSAFINHVQIVGRGRTEKPGGGQSEHRPETDRAVFWDLQGQRELKTHGDGSSLQTGEQMCPGAWLEGLR
jgi:hypothetical protein